MTYTVLARRYRSREFDEVVGQQHIARTLGAAIEKDRVAHAYLFVGTRGVGKTTMARVFAKALNGGSPEVDEAIMAGRDTDVVEIDAASNNRVEEARELIANSVYRPLRGRFKIYIVDEVHMLSSAAFNALLKTLEEPPEHVKFILCTTETHKVPATIQSRCQRFDFRNIATREIAGHLASVAEAEGVEADEAALHAVARLGAGSMRDALSLLDRLMAATPPGGAVTSEVLERVVGLPRQDLVDALIAGAASSDPGAALEAADVLLGAGVEIEHVLEALATRYRDLMVLRACGEETGLVDLSGDARARATALASGFDDGALVHLIALCESVQRSVRTSGSPRALFDALVVRLALTERVMDAAATLAGAPAPEPRPKKR